MTAVPEKRNQKTARCKSCRTAPVRRRCYHVDQISSLFMRLKQILHRLFIAILAPGLPDACAHGHAPSTVPQEVASRSSLAKKRSPGNDESGGLGVRDKGVNRAGLTTGLLSFRVAVLRTGVSENARDRGLGADDVFGRDSRMFNAAIEGQGVPRQVRTDHDPVFEALDGRTPLTFAGGQPTVPADLNRVLPIPGRLRVR